MMMMPRAAMVRADMVWAMRTHVMRTDLAASAVPAVAVPEAGADKANFFGLRAGNADGWIQRHGFSAADRERSSSGDSSHGNRGKNKTTHSSFLPIESKIIR